VPRNNDHAGGRTVFERFASPLALAIGAAVGLVLFLNLYGSRLQQVSPRDVVPFVLVFGFLATLIRFVLLPMRYRAMDPKGVGATRAGWISLVFMALLIVATLAGSSGSGPGLLILAVVVSALAFGVQLFLRRRPKR
jgi:hypothetical protein